MLGFLAPILVFLGVWAARPQAAQAGMGNLASVGKEIFGPFLPANSWSAGKVRNLASQYADDYFLGIDPRMVAAIARVESKMNPKAYRYEPHIDDASYGLMQTLLKTAQWMWDLGNRAFPRPTGKDLYDGRVSIYFGMAYLSYLSRYKKTKRDEEFIVRSYNAGPGRTGSYTDGYWSKYNAAKTEVA